MESLHRQIWAPWRLPYIQGDAPQQDDNSAVDWLEGADPMCFLCRAAASRHRRQHLVVSRGEHCVVVLNRYPYNNGHLLVSPRRHVGELGQLDAGEQQEIHHALTDIVALLRRLLKADGFNVGLNLGRAAGAGLPGHLHWHVVPRWIGDTNFMPVLDGVKVISQSLDALWQMLSDASAEPESHGPVDRHPRSELS